MDDRPLRVALCDDALAYPHLVQSWCEDLEGIELVAIWPNRTALLAGLPAAAIDVLLLDVVLPEGRADAATLATIRAAGPTGMRIVLISSFPPDELGAIGRAAGADGWSSKAHDADGLLVALQRA